MEPVVGPGRTTPPGLTGQALPTTLTPENAWSGQAGPGLLEDRSRKT